MQVMDAVPGASEVMERAARMWLEDARLPKRAAACARQLVAAQPASSVAHELLGLSLL